jgi:hypothetical protein
MICRHQLLTQRLDYLFRLRMLGSRLLEGPLGLSQRVGPGELSPIAANAKTRGPSARARFTASSVRSTARNAAVLSPRAFSAAITKRRRRSTSPIYSAVAAASRSRSTDRGRGAGGFSAAACAEATDQPQTEGKTRVNAPGYLSSKL